jgi:hypothetical protein
MESVLEAWSSGWIRLEVPCVQNHAICRSCCAVSSARGPDRTRRRHEFWGSADAGTAERRPGQPGWRGCATAGRRLPIGSPTTRSPLPSNEPPRTGTGPSTGADGLKQYRNCARSLNRKIRCDCLHPIDSGNAEVLSTMSGRRFHLALRLRLTMGGTTAPERTRPAGGQERRGRAGGPQLPVAGPAW